MVGFSLILFNWGLCFALGMFVVRYRIALACAAMIIKIDKIGSSLALFGFEIKFRYTTVQFIIYIIV